MSFSKSPQNRQYKFYRPTQCPVHHAANYSNKTSEYRHQHYSQFLFNWNISQITQPTAPKKLNKTEGTN